MANQQEGYQAIYNGYKESNQASCDMHCCRKNHNESENYGIVCCCPNPDNLGNYENSWGCTFICTNILCCSCLTSCGCICGKIDNSLCIIM